MFLLWYEIKFPLTLRNTKLGFANIEFIHLFIKLLLRLYVVPALLLKQFTLSVQTVFSWLIVPGVWAWPQSWSPVLRLRPSRPNWGAEWAAEAGEGPGLASSLPHPQLSAQPPPLLRIITSRLSTKSLSPCIILTTLDTSHPPPLGFTFHNRKEGAQQHKTKE